MKTTIRNVEIKSVAAWLPANKISLLSFCGSFPEKQVRDERSGIGDWESRVTNDG